MLEDCGYFVEKRFRGISIHNSNERGFSLFLAEQVDLRHLVENPLILVGKVILVGENEMDERDFRPSPNTDDTIHHDWYIYQDATIEVEKVLKPEKGGIIPPDKVAVRRFGGRVGNFLLISNAEAAPFVPGERVLLLLNKSSSLGELPGDVWTTTNKRYGRFRITPDGRLIRPAWREFDEEIFDLEEVLRLIEEIDEIGV